MQRSRLSDYIPVFRGVLENPRGERWNMYTKNSVSGRIELRRLLDGEETITKGFTEITPDELDRLREIGYRVEHAIA